MMIFMSALSFCDSAKHFRDPSKCFLRLAQRWMHFFLSLDSSKLPKFRTTLQTRKIVHVTSISGQKVAHVQYNQTEI